MKFILYAFFLCLLVSSCTSQIIPTVDTSNPHCSHPKCDDTVVILDSAKATLEIDTVLMTFFVEQYRLSNTMLLNDISQSMEYLNAWLDFAHYDYQVTYVDTTWPSIDAAIINLNATIDDTPRQTHGISVIVLPNDEDLADGGQLMGFTPVLTSSNSWKFYRTEGTKWSVFYISPDGLKADCAEGCHHTTLLHELMHYYNEDHAFHVCKNVMSYNCYKDNLSKEQLDRAAFFKQMYR